MTHSEWSELYQANKHKISNAEDYLYNLNRKYFKLSLTTTLVPDGDEFKAKDGIILAQYRPRWRAWHNDPRYKHGEIIFNLRALFKYEQDYIFEVVRHEMAHAICDMRYNEGGHGRTWIKIAKLLRVDTKRYEHDLSHNNMNCCK